MEKLPLRPLFFVPAYLLFFFIGTVLQNPALDAPGFWRLLLGVGWFAFHFVWVFRALAFASRRRFMPQRAGMANPLKAAGLSLVMALFCFAVGIVYKEHVRLWVFGGAPIGQLPEMLLALATILLFFRTFWIAARTLCEAEAGGKASTNRIIGTFLLFLYLIIGAPFLYRRLKRLGAPLPDGTVATA